MIGPVSYTVGMAMGTSRGRTRQATMWVPTADLPKSAGHPFYERLNRVLDGAGFDAFVEAQCASFYADGVGRPSLAPGRYFRLLLLGYFEGLDSERAIAWRAADSLSIRTFLDFALHEAPPDHSTLSRTRRLIDLETHQAVFTWVLQRLADATLVVGRTVGIDATTLEANAAMRSIVRRDTGESYDAFLTRLAEASGPLDADARRVGPVRPHPQEEGLERGLDPPARSGREDREDGRTAARIWRTPPSMRSTWRQAPSWRDGAGRECGRHDDPGRHARHGCRAGRGGRRAGDRGGGGRQGISQHETMVGFAAIGVRSYVSEPDRGRRHWKGQAAARTRCMPTGGGSAARAGNGCCGSGASCWNGPTRISTRPAGCAASICAGIPTS